MNNNGSPNPTNSLSSVMSNQPSPAQVRYSIDMELANIEKRLEIIQRRKRLVEYQRDSRFSMRTELRNAVIDAEAEALNTDSLLTVLCSSLAEVFGNDAAMYALTIEEMDEEIGLLNGRTEQLNKALLSLNSNIIIPSFSPPVS